MPGHKDWHLAQASMAWQGRSLGQICAQIKDPKRNGGKDMAALIHHMAENSLVGWGWSPGAGADPGARNSGRVRGPDQGLGGERGALPLINGRFCGNSLLSPANLGPI